MVKKHKVSGWRDQERANIEDRLAGERFKLKAGANTFRVLPHPKTVDDGKDRRPWIEVSMHSNVGPNQRFVRCGKTIEHGTPVGKCVVCDESQRLLRRGKGEAATAIGPVRQVVLQVSSVMKGRYSAPKQWMLRVGGVKTLSTSLLNVLINSKNRPYDAKKGRDLSIYRTGEGLATTYGPVEPAYDSSPVPAGVLKGLKPLSSLVRAYDPEFAQACIDGKEDKLMAKTKAGKKNDAEVNKKRKGRSEEDDEEEDEDAGDDVVDDEDEDDEDDAPKKKGKSKKKAAKKSKKDEDEDSDDEDEDSDDEDEDSDDEDEDSDDEDDDEDSDEDDDDEDSDEDDDDEDSDEDDEDEDVEDDEDEDVEDDEDEPVKKKGKSKKKPGKKSKKAEDSDEDDEDSDEDDEDSDEDDEDEEPVKKGKKKAAKSKKSKKSKDDDEDEDEDDEDEDDEDEPVKKAVKKAPAKAKKKAKATAPAKTKAKAKKTKKK